MKQRSFEADACALPHDLPSLYVALIPCDLSLQCSPSDPCTVHARPLSLRKLLCHAPTGKPPLIFCTKEMTGSVLAAALAFYAHPQPLVQSSDSLQPKDAHQGIHHARVACIGCSAGIGGLCACVCLLCVCILCVCVCICCSSDVGSLCAYVCVFVCMYVFLCVFLCVYMCVCVYVYMCVCAQK